MLHVGRRTWNDWVLAKRTLQPAGLVSVGSDAVNTPAHDGHSKQAAIWETGMDSTSRPSFSRAAFVSVVLLTTANARRLAYV